jgi:hypothetical protein
MSAFVLVVMLFRSVDSGIGVAQIEMPSKAACERELAKINSGPKPLGAFSNTNTVWAICVDRKP